VNPASLPVVIFGVLLVIEIDGYEFSQFWIPRPSPCSWPRSSPAPAYWGRDRADRRPLRGAGPGRHRGSAADLRRVADLSRIEFVLLILILLDMVVKPGL
jgi:transglutaminase-like putative cysteine protease